MMILFALIPESLDALRLIPTDSTKVPKAVFLTNIMTAVTTTTVMMMGVGRNRQLP